MTKDKDKHPGKHERTLDDMLTEKYPDNTDLQQRVREDVQARGTEKGIVSGELRLPHHQDAEAHFRRVDEAKQREGK